MRSLRDSRIRRALRVLLAGAVVSGTLALGVGEAAARSPRPDSLAGVRSPLPVFALEHGQFRAFDPPNAGVGEGVGINNRGQVVGGYRPPGDGCDFRGFLRERNGTFRLIDVPGGAMTNPQKINDRGTVVGNFRRGDPCTAPLRGFARDRRGHFTTINVPGSVYTTAAGVNNVGVVVGEYARPDGTTRGYMWRHGRFTTFDVPGAVSTALFDVNDHGDAVGGYFDANGTIHGVVRSRHGRLQEFTVPGYRYQFGYGINDRGQVAGFVVDELPLTETSSPRGFVLRRGAGGPVTFVDVPGATGTGAFDINDTGAIVGQYGVGRSSDATSTATAPMSSMSPMSSVVEPHDDHPPR
jgi:uncharacterized membrane protein